MKKILMFLMASILMFSLVSASMKIVTMPDDISSFEEWKLRVLEANREDGFLATSGQDIYWGTCTQTCIGLLFVGDCNPCDPGDVASLRSWHGDEMSYYPYWYSADNYCNDWLRPYDYYNQQATCKSPTSQCSGGADPGDRKCEGYGVWECQDIGVWWYTANCDYGCSNGECQQQQCTDHETKSCSGNSVYWFDSCGDRQGEYERCESDETCQGNKCVRFCQDGFIGSKLCSGLDIVQQYQSSDCSTEIRTIETCQDGCENSQCIDPQCPTCPDPTAWSQCMEEEMFRDNYKCDVTTDYECKVFSEEQNCECGTSGQCQYDEGCEDNVCVILECEENEIADNHECVEKDAFPTMLVIGITAGAIVLILIIILVVVMIRMKGGVRKK